MQHEYKEILQAIMDGKKIQKMVVIDNTETLRDFTTYEEVFKYLSETLPSNKLRVKPATININGFEFPEPERNVLEVGTEYYTPNLFDGGMFDCFVWSADDYDKRSLECGLVDE